MGQDAKHNFRRVLRVPVFSGTALLLAGCNGEQSALHPAGEDALALSNLFWLMTAGGAVIWAVVMGIAIWATLSDRRPKSEWFADRFILVGGVAFPVVTLALLLVFGLALLPSWTADQPADVRVHVRGEQFWWRMGYEQPDGSIVETANELHLPAGATAEFVLTSTDVIHSFWIPSLGGKMDAIPGRTNVLRLRPNKAGVYRGVCAEYCGTSHALMAFPVVVHAGEDYQAWVAREAQPAVAQGGENFINAGCGACHVVRGVSEADGAVGPDLTHVASRRTIAAGTLPNTRDNLNNWIALPDHIKPDVRMPGFSSLPVAERDAIVDFLLELK